MSKYKVGDKVLIEGEVVEIDNSQMVNTRIAFKDDTSEWFSEKLLFDASKTYSDGLADAWELARKISHMCLDDMNKCFDLEDLDKYGADMMLYEHYTPQQALAKIEAFKVSQQIQVGDVVYIDQVANAELEDDSEAYGVVTGIYDDSDHYEVLMRNGDGASFGKRQMKKTGRHIDISSILEQIRGNE